jgi:LPXTG-site transpeptidase (sortase) family protein
MMQHTQGHRQTSKLQTSGQIVLALVCALWLALGGSLPAEAGTPATGALTQSAQPTRLLIPALGIDAAVEPVGQDNNNWMAAPSSDAAVAWYNLGPIPGATGNAVIAGHRDDVHGQPAIFWHLDELEAGDEITVEFGDKSQIRFAVMTVESYTADAAPMERIFGVDFERDLNLITCDGVWNAQSKLYDQRLVVYARRVADDATRTLPQDSTNAMSNLAKAAAKLELKDALAKARQKLQNDQTSDAGANAAGAGENSTSQENSPESGDLNSDVAPQAHASPSFSITPSPRTADTR